MCGGAGFVVSAAVTSVVLSAVLCAELSVELSVELFVELPATLPATLPAALPLMSLAALLVESVSADAVHLACSLTGPSTGTSIDIGGDRTPSLRGVAARSEFCRRTSRPFSSNFSSNMFQWFFLSFFRSSRLPPTITTPVWFSVHLRISSSSSLAVLRVTSLP